MAGNNELPSAVKIKTEPGISTSQRLPSLRPPRDLSLSAFGQKLPPNILGNQSKNKKVYTPNLNIQRNKNKETPTEVKTEQPKGKAKNLKTEDKVRNKKRDLIQMGSGLFSEGLGTTTRSSFSRSSGGGGSEKGEILQKPKLKNNIKINKEEEEAMMKSLLRDDFVDDPSLDPDFENCPVKLPLNDWKIFKTVDEDKMKAKELLENEEVKTEPGMLEEFKHEEKKPLSIPDFVKSSTNEGHYILLQLPDCMPGLKPEVETPRHGQSSAKATPSTSTTSETETKTEESRCVLNTMSPGCIGKLQILKSGRARLLLGESKMSIQLGTQVAFKQDLISVNLNNSTYTGDMINLGPVDTRMIISPDWEDMLLQQLTV